MSDKSKTESSYLLKVVLITSIIAICLGCLYALYFEDLKQYITIQTTGATKIGSFKIPLIDETDIARARMFLSENELDNIALLLSDKRFISDPNSPIQTDILYASSEANYGTDMPWDRDVKPCEILRNTDQDLYADVQDTKHITLY